MKNKKIRYAMSRRRKNSLLLSVFLFAAAVIWADRSLIHPRLSPPETKITAGSDWDKYNQKEFTVVKVVDGDTLDIDIPDGKYKTTRIRMLGVDTPETAKSPKGEMYYGREASQFTKDMVFGKNVIVEMDKQSKPRDKYGRLLCYIRFADGRILNEDLIIQGIAYADTRFKHSYYEKYIELEESARKEKRGLWEKVTVEQMPEWKK